MSSDYSRVKDALKSGADPEMLCATCPWDRLCIEPPSMTEEDYKRQMDEATAKDDAKLAEAKARGEEGGMPIGTLLTAIVAGGRVDSATLCPVFSVKIRTSEGRVLSNLLKEHMTNGAKPQKEN